MNKFVAEAIFAVWFLSLWSNVCEATTYHHTSAAVQLFEWSWADVANECETFLKQKGYRAVQISPPQDHIEGSQWWTRYQPVTYTLKSRSGDESAFQDMVNRCTKSGVQVIADAVINHMAAGSGVSIAGNSYGNRNYPIYSQQDFHHDTNNAGSNCQVTNYNNKTNVQYCDLSGLPDLCTSCSYVQTTVANYLNTLYAKGVRGLRIDAAKHQDANELSGILKKLPADLKIGMEVIGAAGEAVQPSMYYNLGQVTEFYYADDVDANIIPENKMIYFNTLGESWGLMPDVYADVFLDNHDTQRNGRAQLTYKNATLYTFANIFMLAYPYGNVKIMSSYYFSNTDQGPPSTGVNGGSNCQDGKNWVCEHRWPQIANMVNWRNAAGTADIANWQTGTANQIAFSRNNKAFIAMNRASSGSWSATLNTGLPSGTYCNILASGDANADNAASCAHTVNVDSSGKATLSVGAISAVALHVNAKK